MRLSPDASKNGQGRTLAMEGELWELIERRRAAREYQASDTTTALSPLVFHRRGHPVGDFRKAWEAAYDAANLPGRLFHDLRRTGVRNMVRAGVPQHVAMRVSGHRTAAIFRRYDIVTEDDIREAMRRTQAHVSGQPTNTDTNVTPLGRSAEAAGG